MKKLIATLAAFAAINAHAEVINLVATSRPPECTHGEICEIRGYHEIHIINASINNETMRYGYQLCMDGVCDNADNVVTVYPRQHWDNTRQSMLTFRLKKGTHDYIVRTECGKEKVVNSYSFYVK